MLMMPGFGSLLKRTLRDVFLAINLDNVFKKSIFLKMGSLRKLKRKSEKIKNIIEKKMCWLLAGTLITELFALIALIIILIIINVI